jgi:hypothetical protein
VDYKQFMISAFEREPGRWRARVRRTAFVQGHTKVFEFVTKTDSSTAVDALTVAMNAIDVGEFSPPGRRSSERFWRIKRGRAGSKIRGEQ